MKRLFIGKDKVQWIDIPESTGIYTLRRDGANNGNFEHYYANSILFGSSVVELFISEHLDQQEALTKMAKFLFEDVR